MPWIRCSRIATSPTNPSITRKTARAYQSSEIAGKTREAASVGRKVVIAIMLATRPSVPRNSRDCCHGGEERQRAEPERPDHLDRHRVSEDAKDPGKPVLTLPRTRA